MFCYKCGAANDESQKICIRCGQKLKQKRKFPKHFFIILLECVILAGVGYFLYDVGSRLYSPKSTARQYFVRMVNGEYEDAYKMLTLPDSEYLSLDAFQTVAKQNAYGNVKVYSISEEKPENFGKEAISETGTEMETENNSWNVTPEYEMNNNSMDGIPEYEDAGADAGEDIGIDDDENIEIEIETEADEPASGKTNFSAAEPIEPIDVIDESDDMDLSDDELYDDYLDEESGDMADLDESYPEESYPEETQEKKEYKDADVTFNFADEPTTSLPPEQDSQVVDENTNPADTQTAESETESEESSPKNEVGKTYYITYQVEGDETDRYFEIKLVKSQEKKYFVFDNWVIAESSLWANDVKISVPRGASVEVDGKDISKEFVRTDEISSDNPKDEYVIPYLFLGNHSIKVTGDGVDTKEEIFAAADGYNLDRMNYSTLEVKSLQDFAVDSMKLIYTSAANNTEFKDISYLFTNATKDLVSIQQEYVALTSFFDTEGLLGFDITEVSTENSTDSTSVVLTLKGVVKYMPVDESGEIDSSAQEQSKDTTLQLTFDFERQDGKWVQTNLGCTPFQY